MIQVLTARAAMSLEKLKMLFGSDIKAVDLAGSIGAVFIVLLAMVAVLILLGVQLCWRGIKWLYVKAKQVLSGA